MTEERSAMPDPFDRQLGALVDLPDVVKAGPVVKRTVPPLGVGGTSIHVVQTVRQGNQHTIFLEVVDPDGTKRLVIPSVVADVIARQREACSVMLRKKLARAAAADRKARGEKPGFKMTASERAAAARVRIEKRAADRKGVR